MIDGKRMSHSYVKSYDSYQYRIEDSVCCRLQAKVDRSFCSADLMSDVGVSSKGRFPRVLSQYHQNEKILPQTIIMALNNP